jgi:hypothetical protein
MKTNFLKSFARRQRLAQLLLLQRNATWFFFLFVIFFSGCFDSEIRLGVIIPEQNTISSPTGCNEISIQEGDSVFWDFNLFDQSPQCPVRGNNSRYPYLKVNNLEGMIKLKVSFTPRSELDLTINRKGRFFVLTDTIISKIIHSKIQARLNWFLFTGNIIVYLKYYSYLGSPFQWCLSEAEAINKDFVSIGSISFDTEPDSVGVVPKLESISGLTGLIYRSREDSLIIQSYCLRGFCSNTTVSMKKEKSNVDNSIFWHWLIPKLH